MTSQESNTLKILKQVSKNLHRYDYNDVKSFLSGIIKTVPIAITTTNRPRRLNQDGFYRRPNEIYRACENKTPIPAKSSMYLPWTTVERISHAPLDKQNELIEDFGRANIPGQARFYCSNYYPTACIEAVTTGFTKEFDKSKTVTMGTWIIKEPLVLAEIIFSSNKLDSVKHFNPEGYEKKIQLTKDWYNNFFEESLSNLKMPCTIDYAIALMEFFSDEFGKVEIKSGSDYILSNFYCDFVFNQNFNEVPNTIDGIIYPSVKYSYEEYNIVLHPRAMNKIEFSHASQVWITSDPRSRNIQCSPLEKAFADSEGRLIWNSFKI